MIGVVGGYGRTNFGDDALLYVIKHNLIDELPNGDFMLICKEASYLKSIVGEDVKVVNNEQKAIKECDIFIYGGGTLFYDFKKQKRNRRLLNEVKSTIKFFIRQDKVKRYFLGIGVGPFENGLNLKVLRFLVKLYRGKYIWVRDQSSWIFLKRRGVNCKYGADLCFALSKGKKRVESQKESMNIGVVVRDWDLNQNDIYLDKMFKVETNFLQKDNYRFTYIIFAPEKDLKTSEKLTNKRKSVLFWDPNTQSIKKFSQYLGDFDLIISARYHGCIFSAIENVPFISICIDPKLRQLSEIYESGNNQFSWSYPFEPSELESKIHYVENNMEKIKERLHFVTDVQKKIALQEIDVLRKKLI